MRYAAILQILVDANTRKAQAEVKRFDRQLGETARNAHRASNSIDRVNPAIAGLGKSASHASRSLRRLAPDLQLTTRVPVYKIAAVGAAIAAIVPPAVSLVSALGPLVGLLGALPSAASAAGSAIASIALGMKGVGDAVGAALNVQKTAAKDATATAKTQQAAAEGVRSAIQGVDEARRGLADANRAVGDSERGLADAQRETERAQVDLNSARTQAARDLVDMRLAVQGATLSEKDARIELSRAIEEQSRVLGDEESTALDARDASLAIQRARLGLKEATIDAGRAQKDFSEAQRKGVAGSDRVVSAQEALQDAQRGVADAQRGMADSQRGVADAQRALVNATREVRLAQRDQAQGAAEATAGMEKYQEAMRDLPKAGQNFVRFLIGLKPKLDELRSVAAEGLLPGVQRGMKEALGSFQAVKKSIGETSTALGELAEQAGQRLGSAEWGRDLEVQGERNAKIITRLGTAGLSLADAFRHIMIAAGPMVGFLTRSAVKFAEMFEVWAQTGRESGRLEAFFKRTITTTKLVVQSLWDFGQALKNIGAISARVWGDDLLKGIGGVAKRFREWTESVRGSRDIEAYFVRWRRRWGDIAEAVGGLIDRYRQLRREGKSVAEAFTTVVSDALAKMIPAVANRVAEAAPRIASGFVRGFLAADIWGKLVVGAWLLTKFGGIGAFRMVGATAGAATGTGMLAGMMGKLKGKGGLVGIGALIAAVFGPEILKVIKEAGTKTDAAGAEFEFAAERMERLQKAGNMTGLAKAADDARVTARSMGAAGRPLMELADRFDKVSSRTRAFNSSVERMATGSSKSLDSLRTNVRLNMRLIEQSMDRNSKRGRDAVEDNFQAARANIRISMAKGTISVKEGMREIERLMVKTLQNMGFSKKQALLVRQGRDPVSGKDMNTLGGKQRGGPIVTGAPSGDTVPAMLERGEYVLNRKAVSKVGRKSLDAINYGMAPRFQKGGIAGMRGAANRLEKAQFAYDWGGGHQASPAPFGPMDCSGAVSFVLQHGGVNIPTMVSGDMMNIGKPGGGAVTIYADAGHVLMSILGRFFGTSGTNPGGGAGWIDPPPSQSYLARFTKRHFGSADMGGAFGVAKKIKRLVVDGPESLLKTNVQGALDNARTGANERLAALSQAVGAGGGNTGDAGVYTGPLDRNFGRGNNTRIGFDAAAMLAEKAGLPGHTYAQIAIGESGLRPGAVSTDGGYGLWQMTPRVQSPATVAAWKAIGSYFNPWNNARMAKVLAGKGTGTSNYYGTGSVTDWNRHWRGQEGGLVEMMLKGGAITKSPQSVQELLNGKRGFSDLFSGALGMFGRPSGDKFTSKERGNTLKELMGRLKDVGLPDWLSSSIGKLQEDAAVFGDYASRASALNLELMDDKGEPVLDSERRPVTQFGVVNGATEIEWIQQQLEALFTLRNRLIQAEQIIQQRREELTRMIERVQKQLEEIGDDIQKASKTKRRLQGALEKVEELKGASAAGKARAIVAELKSDVPEGIWKALHRAVGTEKPVKALREELKDQIRTVTGRQEDRVKSRAALTTILGDESSGLIGRRTALNAARGETLSSLREVQGAGSPLDLLGSLPMVGVLGGQIFEAQMELRRLAIKPDPVTDNPSEDTSERMALLEQLLRDANLRTAVSELQTRVFQGMPQFATGGVVAGVTGAAVPVVAHAGEGVFTPDQMAAMGGQQIVVLIQDGAVREDKIRVLAGEEAQRAMRTASVRGQRRLPGGGGGI